MDNNQPCSSGSNMDESSKNRSRSRSPKANRTDVEQPEPAAVSCPTPCCSGTGDTESSSLQHGTHTCADGGKAIKEKLAQQQEELKEILRRTAEAELLNERLNLQLRKALLLLALTKEN